MSNRQKRCRNFQRDINEKSKWFWAGILAFWNLLCKSDFGAESSEGVEVILNIRHHANPMQYHWTSSKGVNVKVNSTLAIWKNVSETIKWDSLVQSHVGWRKQNYETFLRIKWVVWKYLSFWRSGTTVRIAEEIPFLFGLMQRSLIPLRTIFLQRIVIHTKISNDLWSPLTRHFDYFRTWNTIYWHPHKMEATCNQYLVVLTTGFS